jgi:hypothetical protein
MSQPLHLRAPATPATAPVVAHSSSLALDGRASPSPAALAVLACLGRQLPPRAALRARLAHAA